MHEQKRRASPDNFAMLSPRGRRHESSALENDMIDWKFWMWCVIWFTIFSVVAYGFGY